MTSLRRGQIVVFFWPESRSVTVDEKNEQVVPLSVAAFAKKMKYSEALDQLLVGRLRGVRRGRRWYVYESELPAERDHDRD